MKNGDVNRPVTDFGAVFIYYIIQLNVPPFTSMSLWVYILECSDHTLYTGITNNLDRRFEEHQAGINPDSYTATRRPVSLLFAEEFSDYKLAYEWERKLKGWSGQKKRALIEENWDKLKKLAECRNKTHWLNNPKKL